MAFLAHHLCICLTAASRRSNGEPDGERRGEERKKKKRTAMRRAGRNLFVALLHCAPGLGPEHCSIDRFGRWPSIWRCRFSPAKSVEDRRRREGETEFDTRTTDMTGAHTCREAANVGSIAPAQDRTVLYISTTHFTPSNNDTLRTRNDTIRYEKAHIKKNDGEFHTSGNPWLSSTHTGKQLLGRPTLEFVNRGVIVGSARGAHKIR
jgi:hypothetical protein